MEEEWTPTSTIRFTLPHSLPSFSHVRTIIVALFVFGIRRISLSFNIFCKGHQPWVTQYQWFLFPVLYNL